MEASRPWSTRDVVGSHRFLQRVWRLVIDEQTGDLRVADTEPDRDTLTALHRAIDGVRTDLPAMHYNTAVAKLIELANHLTKTYPSGGTPRSVVEPLVLLLAPLCPHLAEELWSRLGHPDSLAFAAFPEADPALLVEDSTEYPIQVNGKVRSRITVPAAAGQDEVALRGPRRPEGRRTARGRRAAQGDRRPRAPGERRPLTMPERVPEFRAKGTISRIERRGVPFADWTRRAARRRRSGRRCPSRG